VLKRVSLTSSCQEHLLLLLLVQSPACQPAMSYTSKH
jgi:hypothetical protein